MAVLGALIKIITLLGSALAALSTGESFIVGHYEGALHSVG